jgi:negative regulator of genetic competence, sporulation and motility
MEVTLEDILSALERIENILKKILEYDKPLQFDEDGNLKVRIGK